MSSRPTQITLIFLIHKIYYLTGVEADGTPKTGEIFESPEAAAAVAVLMIVLSAFVRIGTDEVWDYKKNTLSAVVSAVLWMASLLCMILILVDINTAVIENDGPRETTLFRSFYFLWIGYPIVSLFGWGVRLLMACGDSGTKEKYAGETPEWVGLVKDILYCFLDSWTKGVFALWTAYSAFHVALLQAPLATQLDGK